MDLPVFRPIDFLALLDTPAGRIRLVAAADGQDENVVLAQARGYAMRIAADFSLPIARWGDRLLSGAFRCLFDDIEVQGLEGLQALEGKATLVYLPCHRSHLDYLLLSHIIYRNGLMPPHVAAGDNMNMPLLGRFLRKGGGFFMRRKFKGDALYATVFALYMEALLTRGLSVEFFIEGGRSRTGHMLPPQTGLLGMVLEALVRHSERPIVLVPVYLGYEKLPEGRSFLRELAGKPKRRESWWDLVAALRLLFQRFGRPCLSFGKPLSLVTWLDAHAAGWRAAAPDGQPDMRSYLPMLAGEVVRRIEAAAPLNAVNLLACALLSEPSARLPRGELEQRIAELKMQVNLTGASVTEFSPANCIDHALRLEMVETQGGWVVAADEKAALLEYFRNNVQHHFATPLCNDKEPEWKRPG